VEISGTAIPEDRSDSLSGTAVPSVRIAVAGGSVLPAAGITGSAPVVLFTVSLATAGATISGFITASGSASTALVSTEKSTRIAMLMLENRVFEKIIPPHICLLRQI
jgi:hypothetical protein